MGDYNDAVQLALVTHSTPSTALVRQYASRPGGAINVEQQIDDTLGVFARASLNDGSKEAYEFTEIDKSLSMGVRVERNPMGQAERYGRCRGRDWRHFQLGAGLFRGGRNRNPDRRRPAAALWPGTDRRSVLQRAVDRWLAASADYQFIDNPAFNRDRGPVSVLGARLHAEF